MGKIESTMGCVYKVREREEGRGSEGNERLKGIVCS